MVMSELHRLLGVLLSNKLEVSTKLAIIKEEYQIPVSDELREDVNIMCNLGQGIEEEGIAIGESRGIAIGESRGIAIGESRGKEKIILKMYNKGHSAEFIADIIDMDINNVKAIIENKECLVVVE